MLQCSLLHERYCSNYIPKYRDREAFGVKFWCVCSPKLALESLLEMLLEWRKMIQTLNIFIKNTREVLVKLHVALPKVVYLLFIIIMWSISILLVRTKVKQKNCVRTKIKPAQKFRSLGLKVYLTLFYIESF